MEIKMLLKGKAISSLISVAFSVLMLNGCSLPNSLPDTSPEGMVAIKSTKNTIVYKHEYVDFSQYSQVTLENSKASIDDNWKKSYNKEKRISSRKLADEDIEKAIKQRKGPFSSINELTIIYDPNDILKSNRGDN